MILANMTKDYAQALLDVGFSMCSDIGDSSYECACYNMSTVADMLEPVDKNSVLFLKDHWAGDKRKWNLCSVKKAHMDAIGYAMSQALN